MSHAGRRSLVKVISFVHTATGELGCDDWGTSFRIRGVQVPVCKTLLSVGEYTTKDGVTVLYGNKGYMFHRGSTVSKKIDAWIQKGLRDSQCHGCTIAYKENNVHIIYMKPRRNETEGSLPARSEPLRPEIPNPRNAGGAGGAGGAHDPMRVEAVDGDEHIVPRVPNLPPEPSARQIAEHELTGQ